MISSRIAAQLAVAVVVALGAQDGVAQKGQDLFQQGLVKERAEGKLEEAIQLFQRVVREFGSDRNLAARAWLETGRCYEKLGRPEARKVYERILRDYRDQAQVAKLARRALRGLRPSGAPARGRVTGIQGSGG